MVIRRSVEKLSAKNSVTRSWNTYSSREKYSLSPLDHDVLKKYGENASVLTPQKNQVTMKNKYKQLNKI